MKFRKVIDSIGKKEKPLSRIYGYRRTTDGEYDIVREEAKIITEVITSVATRISDSVEQIISELLYRYKKENIRNRSERLWTRSTLLSLIRWTYAGMIATEIGTVKKSKIYPPIIDVDLVRIALKRVKKEA